MKLRFHTDSAIFYDQDGKLYPEPSQTLEELENKYQEAVTKYQSIKNLCSAKTEKHDEFDVELLRFNLGNYIENLEWKIDLKLLYQNI